MRHKELLVLASRFFCLTVGIILALGAIGAPFGMALTGGAVCLAWAALWPKGGVQ